MIKNAELKQGVVYLVGAGPGGLDFLTQKALSCIREADCVVYDYLVSEDILQEIPASAEKVYVGKQAGRHTLCQDEINKLLIEMAGRYERIVRLKGGDPYIFGRGAEEALQLMEAAVPFQIVPGITAAVAASAYAGIPLTHRNFASEVAFITGHEEAGRTDDSHIDWAALGQWRGTLVFYMGVKNLPMICEQLRKHGMEPHKPAAVVRWGGTPKQQTVISTLSELPEAAELAEITPPSLIIIGDVVSLHEDLAWFEQLPLYSQRIVVTRSRAQASDLVRLLMGLGAEVVEFPTIKIIPPEDSKPLQSAAEKVQSYEWLVFTSVNGVDAFFHTLTKQGKDARALGGVKVCTIGPATRERLRRFGIEADYMPEKYVAESIIDGLVSQNTPAGKRFLLARSDISRSLLPDELRKLGAQVDDVTAYQTAPDEQGRVRVLELLQEDLIDWITFTSSSTVRNFFDQIDPSQLAEKNCRLASIGPVTSNTLSEFNMKADCQAREYTIDGLVRAIINAVNHAE